MAKTPSSPYIADKVPTGIAGLDAILHGGLPRNRLYLLEGFPGTGKTTIALQFLLEGAKAGEKVLYVSLSESREEIEQVAASHGWSLDKVDLFEISSDSALQEEDQYTIFPASEVELSETTRQILQQIDTRAPVRVAFDSLSEFRLLASDPLKYRRQILALKQFFSKRKTTVLLLDDRTADGNDLQLQSICHGVIMLEERSTEHSGTRSRLRVVKLRGSDYEKGYHDYTIIRGGVETYPRLVAAAARPDPAQAGIRDAKSGVAALDKLLGGGLQFGSSTLLLGPAGSGKSSIAAQFLWNTVQEKICASCWLFEESRDVFLQRAQGIGIDFAPLISRGALCLDQMDPARLSPGEFSALIRHRVGDEGHRMVVLDSLNGYLNSMPNDKHLLLHMHELLMYLNHHKVLTILVMAQHGMLGPGMQQPVDVSYMADSVLLLRYFEAAGRVRKAISVTKKRMGSHEDTIREFAIDAQGIHIGDPLEEFEGVLTGIPRFTGRGDRLMRNREPLRE